MVNFPCRCFSESQCENGWFSKNKVEFRLLIIVPKIRLYVAFVPNKTLQLLYAFWHRQDSRCSQETKCASVVDTFFSRRKICWLIFIMKFLNSKQFGREYSNMSNNYCLFYGFIQINTIGCKVSIESWMLKCNLKIKILQKWQIETV